MSWLFRLSKWRGQGAAGLKSTDRHGENEKDALFVAIPQISSP